MAFVEKTNKPLKKAAAKGAAAAPQAIVDDEDDIFAAKENMGGDAPAKKKTPKKKTVEETYQKLTQLEHVLLRPDTYIGSTEMNRTKLWVFDQETGMTQRDVTYVPGLYKIFDEILVNAADNKQRDKPGSNIPSMDTMKVNIDSATNTITVWNNGGGIPVQMHTTENCWLPELIFGHLLTSSNYNDSEKKTTGGRNGYGAKLANIFSTEFTIETCDGARSGKKYKQTWNDNMQTKSAPKMKDCKASENWTCITFKPDLAKFGMSCLDADVVGLFKKRVYDMAGVTPGVKVFLDDERIKIKNFEEYCNLYLKSVGAMSESGETPKSVHIKCGDRWEIVVAVSDGQFQQVSFVNSIATTRGGSHVNHVSDQLATLYLDYLAKKHKGLKLKPFQVKSHLWVFINTLIENPAFDSQTKETLTLKPSAFGSKAEFDDKFFKKMMSGTSILDSILSFGQEKQNKDMKKTDGKKTGRITGIPKLEDANDAGGKNALDCTLILTEGDSAKALAVSGLAVVGRNRYGVFPLRGKVANPRDANHEQIMKNEEIKNLKTILGLQQTNKYDNGPTGLRYGHVMIMADQDPDGSHIKGLLINLFHYYWPALLKHPSFLQEFATPIVKAKKKNGKGEMPFFTLQEYEEWREQRNASGDGMSGWAIKYYKGLGTSSSQEAKEYFSNLPLHVMDFAWEGAESGEVIEMVFSKKRADDRKQWLLKYESDLYVDHNAAAVTYSDFVNKELIHFSMMDNMRSIPSLVDGLKPGQRKILFACFKRKLRTEIKVAQLAGYVAEHSAYHHGEQSLAMAIINMAQTFVGSNNINVLVGSGQFGTRLQGGADAASPRYIFTFLNSLTRGIYNECDDPLLKYLDDDGQSIEPEWYMPILPTVLINGGHGIGTGWSTDVPSYNPRDIVDNIKRMMEHEVMEPMHPWFRGFKGQIELNVSKKGDVSYAISGILGKVNETTLQVTELPVGKWTQQYKEFLETLLETDGGKKEPFIKGYKEYHTDTTVNFEINMSEKSMAEAEEVGLYKKFMLQRNLSISNMHLFNAQGQIVKYDNPEQIMREFYDLRLGYYDKRKDYMVGELERQLSVLDNKCRFIKEVIAGTLKISNRKKVDIVEDLKKRGYAPVVKENKKKAAGDIQSIEQEAQQEAEEEAAKTGITAYDYLLNMPLMSLTLERVNNLQAERDTKDNELGALKCKTPANLWTDDLDKFLADYAVYEEEEELKASNTGPPAKGKKAAGKAVLKKKAANKRRKSWNGSDMSESESDAADDDDDSDDEFVASKAKKGKAAPKQAAKRPRDDGPATTVQWIAPPKAAILAPIAKKEPVAKKQDVKDTPDKTAFKSTKVNNDSDSEGEGGMSLFERLNAKVGGSGETKKLFSAPVPKAKAAAKAPPKKKKSAASSDEGSDCSDEEFGAKKKPAPKKAPAAKKAAPKKKADSDDDDDFADAVNALDDEGDYAPKEPKQPRRAAAAKVTKYVLDDTIDSEEEEDEETSDFEPSPDKTTKKTAPASKAATKAVAAKKKKAASSDEEVEVVGSDSEDEVMPVKKAPLAKKAAAPKSSDFDFDDVADAPKPKPAAKKAAAPKAVAAPKVAAKKAAAPKKKKDDSDDDDFMGGGNDSEDECAAPKAVERAAPRRAAAAAAGKNVKKYAESSEEDDDSEVELMDEDSDDAFSP